MVAVADGSKNKGMHALGLRPLSATSKETSNKNTYTKRKRVDKSKRVRTGEQK